MKGVGDIFIIHKELLFSSLYLIIILTILSIFIYYFFNSISKRNLINLNLRQYNNSPHPIAKKIFAILLYMIEYIIIMPFFIVLWFFGLTVILWLLSSNELFGYKVLLVSTGLIGAIRITAYFKKKLSEDLAKLFPFVAMATFLLSLEEFQSNLDEVFFNFSQLPLILNDVLSFILVILFIEIVLRLVYSIYLFYSSEDDEVTSEIKKYKRRDED